MSIKIPQTEKYAISSFYRDKKQFAKKKSVARNKRAVRQNWRLSLYGTTHTADIISEKILSRNKLFAGHILVTYYHN